MVSQQQPVGDRSALLERLRSLRDGRVVIAYVTSTRPGLESMMAMDVVPQIHKHLQAITTPKEETRIDLFLHTNGGDGTVPWRLVTLLREYSCELTVLVAHHAFSAGTLVALGADRVLMHPMGMLGPIDPTVTTPFNPTNPENPSERLGISVEDVASYIALVRDDVGIRHEDELVQAFTILAQQVNPLALGSVKRSTQQSRMMGDKLLRLHQDKVDPRTIAEVVEKLASSLYYHGHPINRREAVSDLGLSWIEDAPADVASAMWDLQDAYRRDLLLDRHFNPVMEVAEQFGLPALPPPPPSGQPPLPAVQEHDLGPYTTVCVESAAGLDTFQVTYNVVVLRQWNGETAANITPVKVGWVKQR